MIRRFNRLVSLASAVVDITAFVDALPMPGGDTLASDSIVAVGGSFNVESAAARLGLPTVHAGSIGTGANSSQLRAALDAEGILAVGQLHGDIDLGICITMVEPSGERTFVTTQGAEARLEIEHLLGVEVRPTDAVYISGYDLVYAGSRDALGEWLREDRLNGAALFFDPGPLLDQIDPDVLELIRREAFLITCNEAEFEFMQPRVNDRALFARRIGAQGCELYECADLRQSVAAEPANVIDTTGAGDVHTGALIAFLAEGRSWPESLALANRAAAFSVQLRGGASGPTRSQLQID